MELDNERSGALLRNGLSKVRIHANIYKWFRAYANGSSLIETELQYDETNSAA